MPDAELAAAAARHCRLLRARGTTLDRIADLIIATFSIARGHVLLHDGRHFGAMREIGLQILDS